MSNTAILPCKWIHCTDVLDSAEALYQHLCDNHIGRKSQNNLQLSCQWEGCNAVCSKRDHITSHIRVHTPMKPHTCEICKKSFKRPQDLKKHEKIHTEEHHANHRYSKAAIATAGNNRPDKASSPSDNPPYSGAEHAAMVYQQAAAAQQVTLANLVAHQQQLNAVHAAHLMGIPTGLPAPFSAEAQQLADLTHQRILAGQPLPLLNFYMPPAWPATSTGYPQNNLPVSAPSTIPSIGPVAPASAANGLYPSIADLNMPRPDQLSGSSATYSSASPGQGSASPLSQPHSSALNSPYSSAQASPPEIKLQSPLLSDQPFPSSILPEGTRSRKRSLEHEVMDIMQDAKRGRLNSSEDVGRRLDMFSDLLARPDLLAAPPLNRSSISSDGSSFSEPAERTPEPNILSAPRMSLPDMTKTEVDVFNEFLLGLADEYEVPVNDVGPTWAAQNSSPFAPQNKAPYQQPLLYPSLDTYTNVLPGTQKLQSMSNQLPMYPSLASVMDYQVPQMDYNAATRHLPPARLSTEQRKEPIYRRAEKLQAAPGSTSSDYTDSLVDEPSSIRSTLDASSPASSLVDEAEDGQSCSCEDLTLPPLQLGALQDKTLPPLRSVIGPTTYRQNTADKLAHVTSGVQDIDLTPRSPPLKTRSFDETGSSDEGNAFPHKKTKVEMSEIESIRQKRLQAIKILIILANQAYRSSLNGTGSAAVKIEGDLEATPELSATA